MKLNTFLSLISAFTVLLVSSFAVALEPTKITYRLELDSDRFGKATLGRIETQLTEREGQYYVDSHTKAQGMAAILVGNFRESCQFEIIEGRAVSRSYSGGRPKKQEYLVGFDWQNRKVNFNEQESLDMPSGYIVDNCNMPFAIALLENSELSEAIYIVDGKKTRIRGYKLVSRSKELLTTKLGQLETTKVVLEREFRSDKKLSLWLSKQHHFLPVKVEEIRKDRTTTMLITEYQ
ncbi:MAG: DUF3108 domain-containing protein [Pseudomonadota bacterium]